MPTRFLSRSHANSFLPTDPWRTAETHESLENGRDPRTQDRRQNGVASMQHCEFIQLFGQHSKDDREDRDTWHPPRRDTMEAKSNPTTTTTMTTTRITTTRTPPRRTGRMPERCRGAITISAQGTRRPRTSDTQTQDKAINHESSTTHFCPRDHNGIRDGQLRFDYWLPKRQLWPPKTWATCRRRSWR